MPRTRLHDLVSKRAKKHHEEEHENHERWLVSYADMVTLLMCVFIVLFAMATVDASKFDALKESLSGHTTSPPSVLEGEPTVIDGGSPQLLDSASAAPASDMKLKQQSQSAALAAARQREQDNFEQVRQEIQGSLDARGMGDLVQFRREPKGLVVTIVTDKVLFDTGKATIRPEAHGILNALGAPLSHLENPITVEGHTDNIPINTVQFPSNWELSASRSISVLRYLVENEKISASRVSAAGYADQRPVVPNDTAERRAQNRRVEIVVHTMLEDASTTTPVTTGETSSETQQNDPSSSQIDFNLPTLPERPVISVPQQQAATQEKDHH